MLIRGMAAIKAGKELKPFEYQAPELDAEAVLIKVSHCGICHSDLHMMDNDWEMSHYPFVPGHEVVGKVVETGRAVRHLRVGDRVGVGWQRSACMHCRDCLGGNENLCNESQGTITHGHGGFADHMVCDARFCFPLPLGIDDEFVGPLLCGGATVYSALRYAGMGSGQRIGVVGVGGLGHLAVQFAAKLGNDVTVFTTSPDKAELAMTLGAREGMLTSDPKKFPKLVDPLDVIISTVPVSLNWDRYVELLASDGTLTLVGAFVEPIKVSLWPLLTKRRRIMASPIGGRGMIMDMLRNADAFDVRPMIEKYELKDINEAVARVREGRVRFRAVVKCS